MIVNAETKGRISCLSKLSMPLHYHGLSGTFSSAHRNFTRLNKLRACDRPLHCGSCNFENFKNTTRAHISRNAFAFIRFSVLKCIEDVIIPHTWHALLYYWETADMTWEGGYGVRAVTQRMESSGGQRSHVRGREWRCEFVSSPNLDRTGGLIGLIWTIGT